MPIIVVTKETNIENAVIIVVLNLRRYYSFNPWMEIVEDTLRKGFMVFSKEFDDGSKIPLPRSAGIFRESVGMLRGQIMDWRAGIKGSGKCIHILEFPNRYETHVDNFDPNVNPLRHLLFDVAAGTGMQVTGISLKLASFTFARLAGILFG